MLKRHGFKDFIMRGNVIDLSVGIVIVPRSPHW
jgi:large-conductance mechanosensitive channel